MGKKIRLIDKFGGPPQERGGFLISLKHLESEFLQPGKALSERDAFVKKRDVTRQLGKQGKLLLVIRIPPSKATEGAVARTKEALGQSRRGVVGYLRYPCSFGRARPK